MIIKIKNQKYIPGHVPVLQLRVSFEFPAHVSPVPAGAGFVHERLRVWLPPAHVTVHWEYTPHVVHPPFTVRLRYHK